MKYFYSGILLLILSLILTTNYSLSNNDLLIPHFDQSGKSTSNDHRIEKPLSFYTIDAKVDILKRELIVSQEIILYKYSEDTLYIALPVNAFAHELTLFNQGIQTDKRSLCKFQDLTLSVNGNLLDVNYVKHPIFDKDSTLAYILVPETFRDSLGISLNFSVQLPINANMFGLSKGNNICLLTDWYPYVIQDSTQIFHRSRFSKPFPKDASINATLRTENEVTIISSGNLISKDGNRDQSFLQNDGNFISFILLNEIIDTRTEIVDTINNKTNIRLLMLEQYDRYSERIINLVKNTIDYLSTRIAPYPYNEIVIVNLPNKKNFGFENFGKIATVYCDLISPLNVLNPEYDLCRTIVSQYFEKLELNLKYDKWVTEGLVTFIASEVLNNYYDQPVDYFHFAGYYPIYGFNFLSYNSIPIIYTLNNYQYNPLHRNVSLMYSEKQVNNAFVNNDLHHSSDQYRTIYDVKPAMLISSITDFIGKQNIFHAISKLVDKQQYPISFTHSLTQLIDSSSGHSISEFFYKNLANSFIYDYSINSIKQLELNKYRIDVYNKGTANDYVHLIVKTEKDSLVLPWDGIEKKRSFFINSESPIISAKVKLKYAEGLDVNLANNSYVINPNYIGPFTISLRTFFWFQNALMIFGSIG
jgi:hypothetical protein